MALSPVSEESPNYEEVLQKSDSLSCGFRYSGDSFESSIGESNGRYKSDASDFITKSEKYLSDSFESFEGESSPQQRSDSFQSLTGDSSRNYESDSFESLSVESGVHRSDSSESSSIETVSIEDDHKDNHQGTGLIGKLIKTLVDGNLRPNNSFQHRLKSDAHQECSGSDNKAVNSYCSIKIEHLRQSAKRQRKRHPLTRPGAAANTHEPCPVPRELMNRLQLQRIKETIDQVIKADMHDPTTCPDCSSKQAELAQCRFIRMKKNKLEADLLHKKMEEHMYSKDLVTSIGEIFQSLPKLSEEQNAIWERLYNSVKKT
ncbi:hypothetical protein GDO81_003544 [Engystomops pustulosus]|uniref:Uncharacterized protein n=1 Tax=Engystomops pustulosus TaxID=76066 RepID=A0AAV6ZXE2_ENGPU|nr:hypothetical protein GDO81_003544 [Engystomops pustulosus]